MIRYGMMWHGMVWYDLVWYGMPCPPGLHAEVVWGTLSDYFAEVRKQSELKTKDEVGLFPR